MRLLSDASRVPQNATNRSSAKLPGSRAPSPSRSSRSTSAQVQVCTSTLYASTAMALAGSIEGGAADAFGMRVQEAQVRRNEVKLLPSSSLRQRACESGLGVPLGCG